MALPVVVEPDRAWELAAPEDAAAELSDCAAADEVLAAGAALDERDAQPASVAPMAIIEIRTEILIFL